MSRKRSYSHERRAQHQLINMSECRLWVSSSLLIAGLEFVQGKMALEVNSDLHNCCVDND